MSADLEFTGERFVPGTAGRDRARALASLRVRAPLRRRTARARCRVRRRLRQRAARASARRTSPASTSTPHTLAHARAIVRRARQRRFVEGSATALPLADASVDVVVSFETIEHLPAADQPRMLAEFARVLRPDGSLILSSPNRPAVQRRARTTSNPFHLHELDRDELARCSHPYFPAQRWYRQRRYLGRRCGPRKRATSTRR